MFSANKVINIIIEDLKQNFEAGYRVQFFNFFGMRPEDWTKRFTTANGIIILYEGCDYEIETSHTMTGTIRLTFLVADSMVARSDSEQNYLIDKFRDFITWYEFDELKETYPNDDFEPFFPEVESIFATTERGVTIFSITGYINFVKRNIGG